MAAQPVARLTDAGSHGGAVVTGSPDVTVNGLPVARVGDTYACPRHGPNPITSGAPRATANGRNIAHVGSGTACGATIVSGSPDTVVGT
jgi:uncharacterized Zn-binding protein involved in type VI secretion